MKFKKTFKLFRYFLFQVAMDKELWWSINKTSGLKEIRYFSVEKTISEDNLSAYMIFIGPVYIAMSVLKWK